MIIWHIVTGLLILIITIIGAWKWTPNKKDLILLVILFIGISSVFICLDISQYSQYLIARKKIIISEINCDFNLHKFYNDLDTCQFYEDNKKRYPEVDSLIIKEDSVIIIWDKEYNYGI